MTLSSKAVHPTNWRKFNRVAKYEPYVPKIGLKETIVGTPYLEPMLPARARRRLPNMEPLKDMRRACSMVKEGIIRAPAWRTKSPTPRLNQRKKKSIALSTLASLLTGSTPHSGGALNNFPDMFPSRRRRREGWASIRRRALSLRRHYPDQVLGVGSAPAALSAGFLPAPPAPSNTSS